MHYVDEYLSEDKSDARETILCLHGEPTWYFYNFNRGRRGQLRALITIKHFFGVLSFFPILGNFPIVLVTSDQASTM